MNITMPDPNPGRCLNYRKGLRCLDADGHESACWFPKPPPEPAGQTQGGGWGYTNPRPWVVPFRLEEDAETVEPDPQSIPADWSKQVSKMRAVEEG